MPTVVVVIVTVVVVVVNVVVVVVVIVVVVVCEASGSFAAITESEDLVGCVWTNMDKLYIVIHQTETEWGDLEISSRKPPDRSEVLIRLRQLAPATGISEVETVSVVSVVSVVTSQKSVMNGANEHDML